MMTEHFEVYSHGCRLDGIIRRPRSADGRALPVIINPPGFLGLAEGPTTGMLHELFVAAGFAVVSVDYRGYGKSEGEPGWIHPGQQLEDLLALVAYMSAESQTFDLDNMFAYGQGGTGGGNAIILAAAVPQIRAVAAQTVVGDGRAWLRSMRNESEWRAYLRRLSENDRRLATGQTGEMVDPRQEIMVATPERRAEQSRSYADSRLGHGFHLASASHLLHYRPIDHVHRISPRPLMLVSLDGDVVTPPDLGAEPLYQRAGSPKTLLRQHADLTHYEAYHVNKERIGGTMVAFFQAALRSEPFSTIEE